MVKLQKEDYLVAWICALPDPEWQASRLLLDEEHDEPDLGRNPHSSYAFGSANGHNVVMGCLPDTQIGIGAAASVASAMKTTFHGIKFALLVGIGGGVPTDKSDIRLGDVVVSRPDRDRGHGGVKQYDFGKALQDGEFQCNAMLNMPSDILLSALGKVKSARPMSSKFHEYLDSYKRWKDYHPEFAEPPEIDKLFRADYVHPTKDDSCYRCKAEYEIQRPEREIQRPKVFYGTIASGNQVMKDALKRDMISKNHTDVLCFEMEAAGLMNVFPCLVIRGICDYCDSHKNKKWQPFAAAAAAAWAKELLRNITATDVSSGRGVVKLYSNHRVAVPSVVDMLPYDRDEQFVGREDILGNVEQKLSSTTSHCRAALVGLGGVGKSQIAIEYCWRVRERMNEVSILWIHASSPERFQNDYQSIATAFELHGFDDPRKNHKKIVTDWLDSESSGKWVLVVDNADDKNFASGYSANLPNTTAFTMPEYLPRKRGCSTLFTTRDTQAAYSLVGSRDAIIDVKAMPEEEAVELFCKKTKGRSWDFVQACRLATRLDCLPLAITQATAYIMQRERMTISTYLERIYREEEKLLMESQNDLRRDPNVPNSVFNIWKVSFQQIEAQDSSAAKLLFQVSFFDRFEIPDLLLIHPKSFRAALDEAIETLLKYSFLNKSSKGSDNLEMHRLVQLAVRSWIKSRGELCLWNYRALQSLESAYPDQDHAKWRICQLLEPHAEVAIELSQSLPLSNTVNKDTSSLRATNPTAISEEETMALNIKAVRGKLLCKRAIYAHDQGHYGQAVKMAELGYRDLMDSLKSDDPETLHCGNTLAAAYLRVGDFQAAACIGIDITERQRSALGAKDPEALTTMINLSASYRGLGRQDEAMEILLDLVELYDQGLADVERILLMAINELASIFGDRGDFAKEEQLYTKVVEGFSRIEGAHHPTTLSARNNLAETYLGQGRLEEAEKVLNEVVEAKKAVLPNEHPLMASSLSKLASVYYRQDRLIEAYDIQAQAVKISRTLPDGNQLTTLAYERTLAVMLNEIGHYDEALTLAERCADLLALEVDEHHPQMKLARRTRSRLCSERNRRLLPSGNELDSMMARLRAFWCLDGEAPVPEPFEVESDVTIEDDAGPANSLDVEYIADIESDVEAPAPDIFEFESESNLPKIAGSRPALYILLKSMYE